MFVTCTRHTFALSHTDLAAVTRSFNPFAGILADLALVAAARGPGRADIAFCLEFAVIGNACVCQSVIPRGAVRRRGAFIRTFRKAIDTLQAIGTRRHDNVARSIALRFLSVTAKWPVRCGITLNTSVIHTHRA